MDVLGLMDASQRVAELRDKLTAFMDEHIYPNEEVFEEQVRELGFAEIPVIEDLKSKAKAEGLWNLFLPDAKLGAGLTNREYGLLCEIMGRSEMAPECFNCSAPDTGNMEVLVQFGTEEQKKQWLEPLLAGEIRSGISMTEPAVASSDATNMALTITPDGDEYVINGRKWFTTGAGSPAFKLSIIMGLSNPNAETRHQRHSMVLVPVESEGVKIERMLPVFGWHDTPHGHGEVSYTNVRVPKSAIVLGEGRGFEIAQARLGPGRIHHCMRLIGQAERAYEKMCKRANSRVAFGKPLSEQGGLRQEVARSRIEIDQARLLTLHTAHMMDTIGVKESRTQISAIKVAVIQMACTVIDRAIQVHGAAGVTEDFGLARAYARARSLRFADGPDEVHLESIAKRELRRFN